MSEEYKLIVHKLSSPKCFIHYLENYKYSFLWESLDEDDKYSVSTNEYSFNNKTNSINFNKTKLKLRLNCLYEDNYNKTKLILCEKFENNEIKHLDEITLSTNYFCLNKKQLTNITFNKIIENDIGNDIRIELKLNVTLISKQIGNEELVTKWLNGCSNGYVSDNSLSNKRRRSGLCTNSVSSFYQKSKEIEEKKKEESKIFDQQMVNNINEMGNKLTVQTEQIKNLQIQVKQLNELLFEKNIEIDEIKKINLENNQKINELLYENNKLKSFENSYNEKNNENKILIQTMKYQLQCRYGKYNELLNIMKINEKNKLKKYIAQLITDNDDLEFEIQRIADSWRNTSNVMEKYTNKKVKKYKKLKKLYLVALNENKHLRDSLKIDNTKNRKDEEEYESESVNKTDDETEEDIRLWNDNDSDHIDSDTAL